jgi:hypothetical protein
LHCLCLQQDRHGASCAAVPCSPCAPVPGVRGKALLGTHWACMAAGSGSSGCPIVWCLGIIKSMCSMHAEDHRWDGMDHIAPAGLALKALCQCTLRGSTVRCRHVVTHVSPAIHTGWPNATSQQDKTNSSCVHVCRMCKSTCVTGQQPAAVTAPSGTITCAAAVC